VASSDAAWLGACLCICFTPQGSLISAAPLADTEP
jgi:hypothetical protein